MKAPISKPDSHSLSLCFLAMSALCSAGCATSSSAPEAPSAGASAPAAATEAATANPGATPQPSQSTSGALPPADHVPTEGGDLVVQPIQHGSLLLTFGELDIYVDPWSQGPLPNEPKADLILITDIHGDHLDPNGVERVRGDNTIIVGPAAVAEQLPGTLVLRNGESQVIAGVSVRAVPMYNLPRGDGEGELRHPPGRGNGYVLTLGGRRVYISGDTACTPEMKALEDIDVAFVCMNMPYTMPPEEAAECVAAFKPAIVYPYHFRGSDLQKFEQPLSDVSGVEVRVRRWYP